MPLYEHVFLARQDLAQAQVDALAENATKIIEDNKGKVVKTENWGLRSLAYRIAKKYGMEWQELLSYNGIKDPLELKAGQVLRIP